MGRKIGLKLVRSEGDIGCWNNVNLASFQTVQNVTWKT